MDDLLKKLDEKMTSDFVRKLGGLFCFITLILIVAAFIIGAGSLMKSSEKADEAVAESSIEDAEEEAATDEELAEEAAAETEEEAEHAEEEEAVE